jgi:hypothetical protein
MTKPYLRDLRSDAERLQKDVGDWVIAGVETTAPWPTKDQVVPYQGLDFILRASTQDRAPTVCLNARAHMGPDDIEHDVNRSSPSSLDVALRVHNFAWAYLCNGSLEIWDEADDTLLGKSAPYMPVNMFLRPGWHDECLAALSTLQANATED